MGRGGMVLVMCAIGCGRIGFDAHGDGPALDAADSPALDTALDAAFAVPGGAALWAPMDEGTSTLTFADVAGGHSITCTASNCPTPVAGKHAGALHFDGAAMRVLHVTYDAALDPSAAFTVATWIKLDAFGTQGFTCLVSKPFGIGSGDSYSLCIQDTGEALFFSANMTTNDYLLGPSLPLGQWHHLAMTWDGTTKRGYFDGAFADMSTVTISQDASEVVLGADSNGGAYVYNTNGALDDVVIYGRALTAAEIAMLAQ
jgi:hypothetical protein